MDKIDINSRDAKSEDAVAENVRRLGELFPELLTEGPSGASVNIDVLKQLVGDASVSEVDEKYGLSWFGKRNARKMALTPSLGTLLPRPDESEDWGTTKNVMIEGDNLEALKLLQKSYSGQVDVIYIDPPYNTGGDFVYPDSYSDSIGEYLLLTSQSDGAGNRLRSNSESGGRFHSNWMRMMFPRLLLARNLLSHNGFLCVSIGDDELGNLLVLLEDIFGRNNWLGTLTRVTKTTSDSGQHFAPSTDYVAIFASNQDLVEGFSLPLSESQISDYTKEDSGGKYKLVGFYQASLTLERSRNARYAIETPDGSTCIPPEGKRWRAIRETYATFTENGEIEFVRVPSSPLLDGNGNQSDWNVYTKQYLNRRLEEGRTPRTFIDDCHNYLGAKELKSLEIPFDFPKPTKLISTLLQLVSERTDALVLDFFAGSGTTGHAVMEQNALDGGNRQFILVQLPEPLLDENNEQASALAFCREHKLEENIASLTAERLRRAGAKVRSENPMFAGDVGFRVFKLAESNIRAWDPLAEDLEGALRTSEDHLVEGRSELDVLYEILLKRGLDLCIPIETKEIAGHHVNAVGGGVMFACLDSKISQSDVEALAEGIVAWRAELGVVGDVNCIFRDSAFDRDVAKSNMSSILEQAGFTKIQSL